jgi:hypothetical protein
MSQLSNNIRRLNKMSKSLIPLRPAAQNVVAAG